MRDATAHTSACFVPCLPACVLPSRFKYDNTYDTVDAGLKAATNTQGTNIHADSAAVNVNFWITESDAIEDAEALANGDGGMVIYRKEAPSVWAATSYNDERSEKGRLNFVQDAVNVSVPYVALCLLLASGCIVCLACRRLAYFWAVLGICLLEY